MKRCPKCGTYEHLAYWKITVDDENIYKPVSPNSNLYKPCFAVVTSFCECSLCGYKAKIEH